MGKKVKKVLVKLKNELVITAQTDDANDLVDGALLALNLNLLSN